MCTRTEAEIKRLRVGKKKWIKIRKKLSRTKWSRGVREHINHSFVLSINHKTWADGNKGERLCFLPTKWLTPFIHCFGLAIKIKINPVSLKYYSYKINKLYGLDFYTEICPLAGSFFLILLSLFFTFSSPFSHWMKKLLNKQCTFTARS